MSSRAHQQVADYRLRRKIVPEKFIFKLNTTEISALMEILLSTQNPQWILPCFIDDPRNRILLTYVCKIQFLRLYQRIRSLSEKRPRLEYRVELATVDAIYFLTSFGFGGKQLSIHSALIYKISSAVDSQTI